jgi:hypothetical protein
MIDKDLACDGYGLTASQSMINKLKSSKHLRNILKHFAEESKYIEFETSYHSKEDRKKNEK